LSRRLSVKAHERRMESYARLHPATHALLHLATLLLLAPVASLISQTPLYAQQGLVPEGKDLSASDDAAHSRGLDNLIVSKDPDVRAMCMTLLEDGHSVWSQMNQDTFVFNNYLVSRGNVGVYVDVGVYSVHDRERQWGEESVVKSSNTAFFDLCLGWRGLCLDMGPMFDETRERFPQHRSCTFINGLSTCLASILRDHDVRHIDLLSVDIEGDELQAIALIPFQDMSIDVIVMKNSGLMAWAANFLMSVNNFRLDHQLQVDSVYLRRGLDSPRAIQYPQGWVNDWEREVQTRCSELRRCGKHDASFLASFAKEQCTKSTERLSGET
jgi:hypothetical protein